MHYNQGTLPVWPTYPVRQSRCCILLQLWIYLAIKFTLPKRQTEINCCLFTIVSPLDALCWPISVTMVLWQALLLNHVCNVFRSCHGCSSHDHAGNGDYEIIKKNNDHDVCDDDCAGSGAFLI